MSGFGVMLTNEVAGKKKKGHPGQSSKSDPNSKYLEILSIKLTNFSITLLQAVQREHNIHTPFPTMRYGKPYLISDRQNTKTCSQLAS